MCSDRLCAQTLQTKLLLPLPSNFLKLTHCQWWLREWDPKGERRVAEDAKRGKKRKKKPRKLTKKHNKEERNETKDGKDSHSIHMKRKAEKVVIIQEIRKSWMIIDRIQMKRKGEKVVMIQEKRKSWMITDRIQMKRKSSQATQMTFAVKSSCKMWVNKVGGNQYWGQNKLFNSFGTFKANFKDYEIQSCLQNMRTKAKYF